MGVREVSTLVGGQATSHAPMKVSNCGCVLAVAVVGEGLVFWGDSRRTWLLGPFVRSPLRSVERLWSSRGPSQRAATAAARSSRRGAMGLHQC